jgi:hypothetical protein
VVASTKKATDEWAKYGEAGRKATESGDQSAITAALTAQHKAAEGARKELANLGVQALAVFNAAIAAGEDYYTALQKIQPSLNTLRKAYADLGINIDNAALSALMLQSNMLEGAPELMAGVQGLVQTMVALDNINGLNAETFAAMQETGMQMYTRLQAAAAAAGGTTKDALMPMQGFLQEAAHQAELLGVPLDENTQMLIDQSKELGIWKDKGKKGFDLVTDAVIEMKDAVLELIDVIKGIPKKVNTTVSVDYEEGTRPSGEAPGQYGPPPMPTPTPTPTPDAAYAATTAASMANWAYGKDEPPTPIVINLDGQQIAMAVVPHVPKSLRRRGVTRSTWP